MTVLQFIGLFVLMYTPSTGYKILIPNFPQLKPSHQSIIAYRASDRVAAGSNWTVAGTFMLNGVAWEYVSVQMQAITIAGSTDGVPNKVEPPHLSCCCTALRPPSAGGKGLQAAYTDPNLPAADKRGAQVSVTQGTAKKLLSADGRVDIEFEMNTAATTGLTITGTKGQNQPPGATKTIAFKPGAQITFGNTPLCVIENTPCPDVTPPQPPDFTAYYTMAIEPNTCKAAPSNCASCKSSLTACDTSSCPTPVASKVQSRQRMMTVDCSSSQWP